MLRKYGREAICNLCVVCGVFEELERLFANRFWRELIQLIFFRFFVGETRILNPKKMNRLTILMISGDALLGDFEIRALRFSPGYFSRPTPTRSLRTFHPPKKMPLLLSILTLLIPSKNQWNTAIPTLNRQAHAMTMLDNQTALMFGGYTVSQGNSMNDTWLLQWSSDPNLTWKQVQTTQAPCSRSFHAP